MNNSQTEPSIDIQRDIEVLMRDGIILRADIYKPTSDNKHPGILVRTPYGKPGHNPERFAQAGFVVMVQDSRGRYSSSSSRQKILLDGSNSFVCQTQEFHQRII